MIIRWFDSESLSVAVDHSSFLITEYFEDIHVRFIMLIITTIYGYHVIWIYFSLNLNM